MTYPGTFIIIADEVDRLMHVYPHTKKDIGYGYRRTFTNGQRVDVINYRKKNIYIFRVGRGAWLVRQYPVLQGLFDEVLTVIAKFHISDVAAFQDKHIVGLLELLHKAPQGIGYLD